ncbi:MAG: hypothetical protein K6L75_02490 [Cellvibrionaceae bacterium]
MSSIITAIAAAKAIAELTGLDDWLGEKLGDKLGDKAAGEITSIAKKVTGATSFDDALRSIEQNPAVAARLKEKILESENILVQLSFEDIKNARDMYLGKSGDLVDSIARKVIAQNHLLVILLLALNVAVIVYAKSPAMVGVACTLIGGSITALWQERQQVIAFFFGSSLGSKIKDNAKNSFFNRFR